MIFFRLAGGMAFLLLAHTPALAGWREAKTKHFIIYSEQSPKSIRAFATELEQFDRGVRLLRVMDDPPLSDSGRLTIYVLPSRGDIARIAKGAPSGVAGFYTSRASGSLAFVHSEREDPKTPDALTAKTVFFHEYTHHLTLQSMNLTLPLWVTEGSAEFFATARTEKDGSMTFGAPPQHRAFGLFQLAALTIEEMVGATNPRMGWEEREQTYARGWHLFHMLQFDKSRRGQLSLYSANIQKGMPALDAARAAFGDLKKLDRDLLAYRKFAGVSIPKAAFSESEVAIRELPAAEDAILPIAMQSEYGVDATLAPRVLEAARKVAARFPNDATVLAALAEAEQDAGNNKEAVATADRVLAGAPTHAKALIMKARALLAMARTDRAKADWTGLRAVIGKANKIDPDDPEPLMLFYQSYLAQGTAATRNAVDGLLYAQQLVPRDRNLRMMAVRQMIAANKLAEAELLFGPMAYDPHISGETRDAMLKVMAALKARSGKEAVSLLDAEAKKAQSKSRS
ncbi:MAG: hypothetical protein M3R03_07265 [Pseudomonadota bacterium]|nr:hypothetical protein [Pseudomonadota bacterium]